MEVPSNIDIDCSSGKITISFNNKKVVASSELFPKISFNKNKGSLKTIKKKNVKSNKKSPKIVRGDSAGETICRKHLEKILKTPFPKIRPNWLQNPVTGANLEIDCYSEKLKLGLEYNGRQHYEFVPHFHKSKVDAQAQMYRDYIKRHLCESNNVKLIEVSYKIPNHALPKYIDEEVKKLGLL